MFIVHYSVFNGLLSYIWTRRCDVWQHGKFVLEIRDFFLIFSISSASQCGTIVIWMVPETRTLDDEELIQVRSFRIRILCQLGYRLSIHPGLNGRAFANQTGRIGSILVRCARPATITFSSDGRGQTIWAVVAVLMAVELQLNTKKLTVTRNRQWHENRLSYAYPNAYPGHHAKISFHLILFWENS